MHIYTYICIYVHIYTYIHIYIYIRMSPMQHKWTLPMLGIISCERKNPNAWTQHQGKWKQSTLCEHKCCSSSLEYHPSSTKSQRPTFSQFHCKKFVMMMILRPQASFHTSVLCHLKEAQTGGVEVSQMTPKPRWRMEIVSDTEPAAPHCIIPRSGTSKVHSTVHSSHWQLQFRLSWSSQLIWQAKSQSSQAGVTGTSVFFLIWKSKLMYGTSFPSQVISIAVLWIYYGFIFSLKSLFITSWLF